MKITGLKCLNIINLSTMVRVRFENYLSEMSKNDQFIHHGVYCHRWDNLFTGIVGTICLLASLGRFGVVATICLLASLGRFVYWHRWDDLFTGVVGTICLLASLGRFEQTTGILFIRRGFSRIARDIFVLTRNVCDRNNFTHTGISWVNVI